MRAAFVVLLLSLASTGCSVNPCKRGTVFLSFELAGGAEVADALDVALVVGAGPVRTKSIPRKTTASAGSIEVDFDSYPTNQQITITLSARVGSITVASETKVVGAGTQCARLDFSLHGAAAIDLSGSRDLGSTVDQGEATDLASDLGELTDLGSSFDLLVEPDLAPPFSPGPSCAGLPATCGAASNCCDSPIVVGGAFYRSHDNATDLTYADSSAPATVGDFRLDRFEVTVGRFRKFLDAGKGTQEDPPGVGAGGHSGIVNSGWDSSFNTSLEVDRAAIDLGLKCHTTLATWTDTTGGNENRPINCVTWHEAMAFCAWDGGFLPTEAEWNYAAAGGAEQRAYPWSDPPESLVLDNTHAVYACGGGTCTGVDNIGTVGSQSPRGDGKFGQSDLAGSVWEWTLDLYNTSYVTPCDNCAELTTGTVRVKRGGGFTNLASNLRVANRDFDSGRDHRNGFRCARPK